MLMADAGSTFDGSGLFLCIIYTTIKYSLSVRNGHCIYFGYSNVTQPFKW